MVLLVVHYRGSLKRSTSVGLDLNISTCELFIDCSSVFCVFNQHHTLAPEIQLLGSSEVMLWGPHLLLRHYVLSFSLKFNAICILVSKLEVLFAHDTFYVPHTYVHYCYAIPKLLYGGSWITYVL